MDGSPPGSSVHGILEWVAIPSSRGSSWPRDQTCVSYISCIGRRILYCQCYLGLVGEKLLLWHLIELRNIALKWVHICERSSLVAQMVKNLPVMWRTRIQSLGREDPLEEGMATHSSILAWRIPWTEEPGGLQSMRSRRVRHDWLSSSICETESPPVWSQSLQK